MKKNFGGVLFNEAIFSKVNVKDMIDAEGCAGIGMFYYVLTYLKKCYHSIGMLDDHSIRMIARMAHKHDDTIKNFILKWGIFEISESEKYFVYEKYRKNFGFKTQISDREAEVISIYGNKIRCEPEEYTLSHPVTDVPTHEVSANASEMQSMKNVNASRIKSEHIENVSSQTSDCKEVTGSLYIDGDNDKGIDTIRKDNSIHIPTTRETEQALSADADAEKSFNFFEKKILNATQWRKSVKVSLGINLEDDNVARIFAKWMFNYCIVKNKTQKSPADILDYAANLLLEKHSTRIAFEKFLAKETGNEVPSSGRRKQREERPVYAPKITEHRGTYEQLIDGRRIGLDHQILPPHAPKQRNENERWSYIKDCYVDVHVWDRMAEEAARFEFERNVRKKEDAKRQAFIDECRRVREAKAKGIHSVGDIIEGEILPNMKHK